MNLKELDSFKLSDAVTFHDKLNPKLWNGTKLRPAVREQLLIIAQDFLTELGVNDLDVKDITISGSNAAFSYTKHSDLDLHILVDMGNLPTNEVYKELFNAKKTIYNDTHDITINTIPVELYVQDSREPVVSLGEYSVMNDEWIKIPTKRRSDFDQTATKSKYEKLLSLIEIALKSKKYSKVKHIIDTIKRYRQAGLDKGGEFGPENLAYKMLRSQGYITKLYELRDKLHSEKLSFETMYRNVTDEDYDPNGVPPGPEFKPTMPAGTVRVDVSDVYDWYKLGQNISNLDRVDPKIFGKGPPSTIMAFGDENTEHNYINNLKKLGLTTTDIDPVDPNQPKNMPRQKVDPTYNVNEEEEEKNHWYDAGVRDAIRGARPNPRTYLPTLKDKQAKHPEEVYFYMNGYKSVKKDVNENEEIHNYSKLDNILDKLCNMVIKGQKSDKDYGMVAACVLDPDNNIVAGLNSPGTNGKRVHAERVAIEKYENKYGTVPEGSIVITTLSPCSESDDETAMGRVGESCTDYLNSKGIEKVYCGYMDPTQDNFSREFNIMETSDKAIRHKCKQFADTFLKKEINEAFDQPYPLKWEISDYGDVDALARLPDGRPLSIMFNKQQDNDGEAITQVEFYRNNSQEVTGEGDAQRIFATVLTAIQQYVKKYKPLRLTFSASKEIDMDADYVDAKFNPESRAKLYDRLVQRYARAWGYRTFRADNGDLVIYELSRIQKPKAVGEDYTGQFAAEKTPTVSPYAGVKDNQYRGGISEAVSMNFEEGDCPIFAIALHRLSKLPLMALVEYDEELGSTVLIHAYVKLNDRWRLDIAGETDVDWMLQKYPNNGNAEEIEIGEKDLLELGYGKSKCPTLQQVLPHAKEVLQNINEASGYIPSEKEKNDPRFKTALTVDINPYTMKKGAKQFGWNISRAGIPPTAKPNGKI